MVLGDSTLKSLTPSVNALAKRLHIGVRFGYNIFFSQGNKNSPEKNLKIH
jgi:hypothetical protein